MVECSFCSSSKSQRYLYTICQHFVCINCAALRAGQTILCCNKITVLEQDVKEQLKTKKEIILDNLQKGYEYEKTDMNKISFEQIEKKLNKINHFEDNNKTAKKVTNEQNRIIKIQTDEQKNSVRMNEFQSNRKEIDRQKLQVYTRKQELSSNKFSASRQGFEVQLSTPIKLVSHTDEEWQQQQRQIDRHVAPSITLSKPSQFKIQSIIKQQQIPLQQRFKPLLENKITQIKVQFNSIHQQLEKMEINIVRQVEVYFQEYVKLIVKDVLVGGMSFQMVLGQKERVSNYLDQLHQKWNLRDIQYIIQSQKDKIQRQTNLTEQSNNIYTKQRKLQKSPNHPSLKHQDYQKSKHPQESFRLNSQFVNSNLDANQSYFEALKLNSMRQIQKDQQNDPICQPATTNRNLDKIYRKLQQSRTKLQQRIHLHNQFMNKKCTNLTNY